MKTRARKMTKKIIRSISVELDDDTIEEQALEILGDTIRDPETKEDSYEVEIITNDELETCNECGISVAWGSGWYVNRVPDFNSVIQRIKMGKRYPLGDYICARCDNYANSQTIDEVEPWTEIEDETEQGEHEYHVDYQSDRVRANSPEHAFDIASWLIRMGEIEPKIERTVKV